DDDGAGKREGRTCAICKVEFASAAAYYRHECSGIKMGASDAKATTGGDVVAGVFRALWTHNPFYLVSACLVLYGLSVAFGNLEVDAEVYGWAFLGSLAGYAALLAVTAVLIVRVGKVWDDARTILVTIALVLLAMSTFFDGIMLERPWPGVPLVLVTFAFAAALCEGLLRAARIRLPALFRAPFHATLALFFLYPVLLTALVWWEETTNDVLVSWGIFLFPFFAGGAILSLVPAARRGRAYAKDSGTPWRWPYFPWLLFGVTGAALCLRTYWLTLSFYPAYRMITPFGLYLLAPIILASAVLMLELGITERVAWIRKAALALPLVALVVSFPGAGGDRCYGEFRDLITAGLASPGLIATLGAAAFYVFAWIRRERLAEAGLMVSLGVLSVVGRGTVGTGTMRGPGALIFAAMASVQAVQAFRSRTSLRAFFALVFAVAAAGLAFEGAWAVSVGWLIPAHLVFAGSLLIALAFHDRFARFIQDVGAYLIVAAFAVALVFAGWAAPDEAQLAYGLYAVAVFVLAPAYWLVTRNVNHFRAFLLNVCALAIAGVVSAFRLVARPGRTKGAGLILGGAASFVVAALISLVKAGGLRGALRRIEELADLKGLAATMRKRGGAIVATLVVLLVTGLVAPGIASSYGHHGRHRRTKCASNVKQLVLACALFAGDHEERFPSSLRELLPEYMNYPEVYLCPTG
ncbi:MAG: hypothetical protein ACYS9X_32025, partial [Planctomycetota bacterium]